MCGFNPLKSIAHVVGSVVKSPIFQPIADVALAASGNPELIPVFNGIDSAVNTKLNGGTFGQSILSGGASFAGNAIGSSIGNSLFPNTIGSEIGSANNSFLSQIPGVSTTAIGDLGGSGLNTAANSLLNTSIGSAVGGLAGQNFASNLVSKQKQPSVDNNSLQPTPFTPTRAPQLQLPGSLSGLQGQDNFQQTSNLATQGVYGGGLGPQEQSYFTNLVNNQLVDPSGKVGNVSSLSPIENSYLSQLGFGGYSNSKDLLGAISKWQKQQPGQASA